MSQITQHLYRVLGIFLITTTSFCEAANLSQKSSLGERIKEIKEAPYPSDCEYRTFPLAEEVAALLDAKEKEINEFSLSHPSPNYELVPFGDYFLRKYIGPEKPNLKWSTDLESWDEIYSRFLKIKDTPLSREWVTLYQDVSAHLVDDETRIFYSDNLDLSHDSLPLIESLLGRVRECLRVTSCSKLELDPELLQKTAKIYRYSTALRNLDLYTHQQDFLLYDKNQYLVFRDSTVSFKIQDGVAFYEVPLDGTDFNDDQRALIKNEIETTWTGKNQKVKIEWKNKNETPNIYKIILENKSYERAYVSRYKKEMHLFSFSRVHTISHEFGHILGFPDYYYTIWDNTSCAYQIEYQTAHLMSDSLVGDVTEKDWQVLLDAYLNPESREMQFHLTQRPPRKLYSRL